MHGFGLGDKMEYLIWTGNLGVEDEAAAYADAHAEWCVPCLCASCKLMQGARGVVIGCLIS